ncbi:TonB-dependent receptor [Psychrosphaera haliotis]|uniref:TonB-dependent receptor plug domain-containing protein n=1 Tax=Psychrosphaera haliotis TaxID=555083 RepID=A0A6N8F883_9GAMM|nr:TonB-dependent receptor [Psychrosphaera haliotis]MUH71100.1 TonB-dependent receptor plug domain-containing protein [Psychrosphaera haliotis]
MKKAALALSIQAALLASLSFNANAQENAQEQDDAKLEKITVTALKRTQSIQDVPVSIATMSGERFENTFSSGDDILSLAARVPGLYAESSNGRVAPRFYMRGLGNSDFDLAASQPVSIIMDDVVMENVVLKSFPLFDIDQVEVIRGPQGSLFGRNTTAGIIKFTSRKPTSDFDAYVKAGMGSFGLVNLEGAVGGQIAEDLNARLSVLDQSKDDWIDNAFTGEKDALGGHDESAFRIQLAYNPTEDLDILFNYHDRSLEGTSSVMRANILTTGSNELNANYDRDKVFYDDGDNNPQEYDQDGWSLNVNYDLGAYMLTSITAMENADGRSKGDIDGGYICAEGQMNSFCTADNRNGPGFIPFGAITEDRLNDLEQFTQEIRIASNGNDQLTWQTGLFYFDSSFGVESVDGFYGATEVFHENTTWAVFGQSTYAVNDDLTIIGGLRYTYDEKSISVGKQNEDGFAVVIGAASIQEYAPIDVDDGQWSWEAMANYTIDNNMSVYARLSNGFRAQSIQGRDVAFEGYPSVAEAETIMSYEAGFKTDLLDNTLRLNGAVFHYVIDDIQLTAVGGNGNNVGLTNAGKGVGTGFEIDSEYRVNENLTVTAGFSFNDTELQDKNLLISTCGSGACTPTDPLNDDGAAYVDGNPFPNAPKTIFTATARYSMPIADEGELFIYSDYSHQGDTNLFIYETEEYKTDGQFELGLRIGYVHYDLDLEVAIFGRNITDEDNLKAGIDFNNNTGIVNEPMSWGIEVKKNFF